MKKLLRPVMFMISISLLLLAPTVTRAADIYYDLGDESKLYIVALVCKIADCLTIDDTANWYDYSTTSDNIEGDAGAKQTLVVKPGDVLTFLGATKVEGDAKINPIYGTDFTNGSYLTFNNVFTNVLDGINYADIDNDTDNVFHYHDVNNIDLSNGLDSTMDSQSGAITATVNSDVPDGTVITGTFYVVDLDQDRQPTFGPRKVLAAGDDLYLRSTVRLLVSNPAPAVVATATPVTLPATGADSKSQLPYLLLATSIILASSTIYVLRRAKK